MYADPCTVPRSWWRRETEEALGQEGGEKRRI